ncbi:coiled-coil and C2 domain-containing protein 2A isoform X2 [Homalodisca vitripennis]|nr:coiled-coil and C2 domain-containing protein 2A isoform X2 [Homalodisca vitripennis]
MNVPELPVKVESLPAVTYLLELEVSNVSWFHHPLFSREHVAVRRLLAYYSAYRGRVQAGLGRRLANKLQALRTARENVKRVGDNERYIRYKQQVRETRELRLEEGKKDRAAVVNCLRAWLDLRTLRHQQGYSVTSVSLRIVELEGSGDNVMFGGVNEWDTELKCQVAERLEEEDEEYKKKMEELKEDKEGEKLKEMLKRPRSEIFEEVKSRLGESLTPPGEPVIVLELGDEPSTPEIEISDNCELERRVALKRCHMVVRVLYNKRVVCRSRSLSLYPHFSTSLNQMFSLQVKDWPQSLALQLVMEGGIGAGKRLSTSVFIPMPSRSTTLLVAPVEHLEFSTPDKLGPYPHGGVGCGLTDSSGNVLYTGGTVTCRVGWGEQGGPPHRPPSNSSRTLCKTLTSVRSLREWSSRAQLDPNDPANADLFEYIKGEKDTSPLHNEDQNKGLPDGDFCTMDDIENNPRLKLLSLRNQMVPEFRDIRNIPIRDREIPEDIFKIYEKRVQCPVRSGPGVGETGVEWQLEWSRQQLDLIRDDIVQHCRQSQQQHSLREVVLEDQVPDIGTLGLTFMKWLQPKRPLRPTRKERKKLPVMGLVGQEVEVIVNVVRAFEVPVRIDVDPLLESDLPLVPVRPFVEVSFQNRKCRTTTAEGANPTWNQDLRIPVKLASSGLYNVPDKLYCQLYDETVVDLLEDDRQRETNIHQRLQRQWLGSLQIPFSSLCSNSRIEGTFQLYSPPVLLGYQRESQHRQVSSSPTSLRDSTFLTLFITVHPPLHPPEPFKEHLPCSEMPYLEQHLQEWQAQVVSQYPHRPVKCLVVDTSAKSICVTRFFQPLAPPVLEEGVSTTPEMALRFVSKIPMVPGSMLFPGLFDVWLTAQQVLTLLSGDSEDHAVLLCCYLLHLGLKAWLLLGSGVPHGPMALVLTRDISGTATLWDPATGQQFNTQDSFCPLHHVYCLINQDNIWANIQREEVVSRTKFDVTRRGDWWPAFNRNVAAPMESVQPTQIEYTVSPTLKTDVALLQDKLEKILRDSITKWRPTTRTVWNRYVTVKLRKLLPGLEKAAWSNNLSVSSEHINQLSQTLSSHKMCGFTQNFAFTKTEEIVEAVRATGVHTNENPDVEFALAVYIHPFVCSVLSVWVYVTSLTLRR